MATFGNRKLFIFAADQKMEHLNADFLGEKISTDAADPEHLFKIAQAGKPDFFATHLGLIEQYGSSYKDVKYLAKLNGRTNCMSSEMDDPKSPLLWSVADVVELAKAQSLNIGAVGYTIFLGSKYENVMLQEAAKVVRDAHRAGLVSGLWIYPKGASVKNKFDPSLAAGAAGIAVSLGADFVKIYAPRLEEEKDLKTNSEPRARLLVPAVNAAGRCKVICAGGKQYKLNEFLENIWHQVNTGGVFGVAVGRNIFQRPFKEAVEICNAIKEIIHEGASF